MPDVGAKLGVYWLTCFDNLMFET